MPASLPLTHPTAQFNESEAALYAYAPPAGPDLRKGPSVGEATNTLEGSGAFATGQYRNLFAEAGHSQAEVKAKIDAAFQQLFHGDPGTQAVYCPAGANANGALAYIYDPGNQDVRSEGMSYGMMIAVQLNRKTEFDALWNWARTCMYHASSNHPAYGYFSWSMTTNGVANDEMPAPDGEEYFVTSLYFAAGTLGQRLRHLQLPAPRPTVCWPTCDTVSAHHRFNCQRHHDRRRAF